MCRGQVRKGLSLRGKRASLRDRFFKQMRFRLVWLRVISLDEFCWQGVFQFARRSGQMVPSPCMSVSMGANYVLRSLASDLLKGLGALPLRVCLDQSQDLLPNARKRIVRGALLPVHNLIAAHKSLSVASLRGILPSDTGRGGKKQASREKRSRGNTNSPLPICSDRVGPSQQGVPQDIKLLTQCERIDLL